jgi:phage gpG-like protein
VANIGIVVDTAAWEAGLDLLIQRCREAAFNASMECAQEIQKRTRALLLSRGHFLHTKTPSAPGTPPAFISGNLALSVVVRDDGDTAEVGPTTDYGRIQELGGTMHGHPLMRWQEPPGVWHSSFEHGLPSRPYLEPATNAFIASGMLTKTYYDWWLRAIMEATG